jgi:hypothetical protein
LSFTNLICLHSYFDSVSSYFRQDGPKIGTTTVIEGTGALKGIQMMTVGVIDDMEVSSPAK